MKDVYGSFEVHVDSARQMIQTLDEPGALHALSNVLLEHEANITQVVIIERREGLSTVYLDPEDVTGEATGELINDLEALPIAMVYARPPSFQKA